MADHEHDRPDGNYLVLARKYRPPTFDDLVGQEHVARTLTNAIEQGRVHHAYLFTGSRGLGKTSAARILAKALNCDEGPTPTPCGKCWVCKLIANGQGGDQHVLHEIDGASHRSVDDARELRKTIGQKTGGRYHVIIIDEVHMLTNEAFNTLLKTLEEPPPYTKFVFATTEVQKLPDTIISRCQRLDFRRIPAPTIARYLGEVAENEGVEADAEALHLIARLSEGGMRDSLSMMDQAIAFCGKSFAASDVEQIFGVLSRRNLIDLVGAMTAEEPKKVMAIATRAYEEGLEIAQLVRDLIDVYRDVAILKACGLDTDLVDAETDDRAALAELGERLTDRRVQEAIDVLLEALVRIRNTGFPRLILEMALLKITLRETT